MATTLRRGLLPLLLLGFLLAPASSEPAMPRREPPTDLETLGRLLDALPARIEGLVQQANQDPKWRDVNTYKAYDPAMYANPKRPYKAKDVLDVMTKATDTELRGEALKALTSANARAYDPDLEDKKGQRKPRATFAQRYVVDLLSDDDPVTRALGHELLVAWFGKPSEPAILNYDARNGSKTSWKEAEKAWTKVLRR